MYVLGEVPSENTCSMLGHQCETPSKKKWILTTHDLPGDRLIARSQATTAASSAPGQFKYLPPMDGSSSDAPLISAIKNLPQVSL